jgi:hypothetical protein
MPIVLSQKRFGPLTFYRDAALLNPFSLNTWAGSLNLGRIRRPGQLRINLFDDGDLELSSIPTNIRTTSNFTMVLDTAWTSSGGHSLKFTAVSGTGAYVVYSSYLNPIALRPGRKYSCGMDVRNGAIVPLVFRLDVYAVDASPEFDAGTPVQSTFLTVQPGAADRIEVLNFTAPTPHLYQADRSANAGSSFHTPFYFRLSVTSPTVPAGSSVWVDSIFVGEGSSSSYAGSAEYWDSTVSIGEPVKVWLHNESATSFKNIRVAAAALGARASRPYVEVSPQPDLVGWTKTYNRFAVVQAAYLASGDAMSFWLRAKLDRRVEAGVQQHLALLALGDL